MTTAGTSTKSAVKRKPAAAGLSTGGRTVKRRASKACHCCRSRKVRCDVVESGIPCTNCRLDEVECVVTEGKRRRKSYVDADLLHHSPCASVEEEREVPTFPIFDDIDGLHEFTPCLDGMAPPTTLNTVDCDIGNHKPHMLCKPFSYPRIQLSKLMRISVLLDQTQGHRLSNEERSRRMSVISNVARPILQSPHQTGHGVSYFPHQPSRADIVLPQYIQPLPMRILSEDLEYLQKKGAFIIPETGLRNELLRIYAQYVHPYLPLIDLEDFLAAIEKNEPTNTVSLLLFQSVMFTATAYIDLRFLVAQGYDTRRAARKAFFQRAKLLYDFDYEIDRVTVVQSVLLMTYWYENPDDPKDIWHWLGIAISLARTIGLNCNPSNSHMDVKKQRLWKRIWWCCFTRDRLVAIGMRRPMRIKEEDFDVPMLELEDFETTSMPNELSRMLGGCPAIRDSSKRVTLAKMCIALTKLCQCITHVLAVQYSVLGQKVGATRETTMKLVPKKAAADPCDVIRCDRELESWHNELSPDLHYFASESRERINVNDGEVLNLHRALLTSVYLTAISALHRPQIMPSTPHLVIAPELQEMSKRKVREAANDVTNIFKDLYAHDLIRYLPTTGVTVLLPALIVHMLDIKSNDQSIRQASVRRFQFCMQALQRLREMYASADFAFSFLDAAVRKVDVQIGSPPPFKVSHTTHQVKFDKDKLQQGGVLLTPPPEAMQSAKQLLFSSTLAPEEKKLIAAFSTPPGSDRSLNSIMTGGAAITLTELESPQSSSVDDTEHAEPDEESIQNDFDTLVNLEGGHDMFTTEDGLDIDLNMQWLHSMNSEGGQYADMPTFGDAGSAPALGYMERSHMLHDTLDSDLSLTA